MQYWNLWLFFPSEEEKERQQINMRLYTWTWLVSRKYLCASEDDWRHYQIKMKESMDFNLLDPVSASELSYTINSLDILPVSSSSCIGDQKRFPSIGGFRSLFKATVCPALGDPQYPSGPAASPAGTSPVWSEYSLLKHELGAPCPGKCPLFLCCSALVHLMTVIMSPVPCFVYANQLPFVHLPCCLLSHHLSSGFPQLLPAACMELCPSLRVCRGLTLPAKTIPLVAFQSCSVLS